MPSASPEAGWGRSIESVLEPCGSCSKPALRFGLHIFDRNLNRPGFGPKYRFPDGYQTAIKGSLNYEEMLTAYRCYDVMLNTNSVTDSPTMFSRRVFECLACGNTGGVDRVDGHASNARGPRPCHA